MSERAGWRRRVGCGVEGGGPFPSSFRFWSRRIDARCPSSPVQRVQCLARAGRSPRGRGSWPWPSDRTPTTPVARSPPPPNHPLTHPPLIGSAAVDLVAPCTPRCLPGVCHRREQSLRSPDGEPASPRSPRSVLELSRRDSH